MNKIIWRPLMRWTLEDARRAHDDRAQACSHHRRRIAGPVAAMALQRAGIGSTVFEPTGDACPAGAFLTTLN
jgi:hypothetical protein